MHSFKIYLRGPIVKWCDHDNQNKIINRTVIPQEMCKGLVDLIYRDRHQLHCRYLLAMSEISSVLSVILTLKINQK